MARALASSAAARRIDSDPVPDSTLRRAQAQSHGDWVSTIALRSATSLHTEPRTLAEEIASRLRDHTGITRVDVAGPGFLNITVSSSSLAQVAADIVGTGTAFGPDQDTAARIEATVDGRIASNPELRTLLPAVGSDTVRFLAARSITASSQAADVGLLRTAHPDNPVYFVQVAHSSACRVERRAAAAGISADDFDPSVLTDATETALAAALADFITTINAAACTGELRRITCLLEASAQLFLDWAKTCPVTPSIDEDITRLHASRLVLDRAAIIVLATGLRLLGVRAPERM
nr:DALR anticodon-binding domain-containing protein [Brevibacterium sp. RIT 803]